MMVVDFFHSRSHPHTRWTQAAVPTGGADRRPRHAVQCGTRLNAQRSTDVRVSCEPRRTRTQRCRPAGRVHTHLFVSHAMAGHAQNRRVHQLALHLSASPARTAAEPASAIELANGRSMPQIGYGAALFGLKPGFNFAAFPSSDDPASAAGDDKIEAVIGDVLDAGYRHIDTAHCYHTELPIGRALATRFAAGLLSRDDVWVTTKTSDPILSTNSYMRNAAESSYDGVLAEFAGCLARLGLEYVDTLLLHWPGDKESSDAVLQTEKRADMWRALETIYAKGQARSIGVSNFTRKHLEPLLAECSVVPHVNQIECHTRQQQHELAEYCHSKNIRCTAYSPISGSNLDDPILQRIAASHGVSPGDVVLRWLKQRGIVAIPKVSAAWSRPRCYF